MIANSTTNIKFNDFFVKNHPNKVATQIFSKNIKGLLTMSDLNQFIYFQVQLNKNSIHNWNTILQMPSPQSRIMIGGFGDYLYSENHKLVIK